MKYSSFLYLSFLLFAIDKPWRTDAKGFFGKLVDLVTGGDNTITNKDKNNMNSNIKNRRNNSNSNDNTNNMNNNDNMNMNNNDHDAAHDFPTIRLSNGVHFPLVGLGVGNMQPEFVPAVISHGLDETKNIRLIDTAHVSKNEFLVARGIVEGVENRLAKAATKGGDSGSDSDTGSDTDSTGTGSDGTGTGATGTANDKNKAATVHEVHVITKVWYTHLGYQRTLHSANESLESFREAIDHPNIDLKVHILLHWPRCYDEIPWMDCNGEEEHLPEATKRAGPPPNDASAFNGNSNSNGSNDTNNTNNNNGAAAWKDSWRALEELVADTTNPIASIGVSNFHRRELEEFDGFAKILPHLVETNTWSLLYDPLLIEFCHKRNVHLVAYNLMEGILYQAETAPFATHHLLSIANEITNDMRGKDLLPAAVAVDNNSKNKNKNNNKSNNNSNDISAAQVVLAWLLQHSISVVPRTTSLAHLQENSAVALSRIPAMDDQQVKIVAQSVEALISGEDLTEDAFVTLTFHAKSRDVFLYWHDPEFGGEIEVAKIQKGTSFEESSHPGHQFKIYDVHGGGTEFFDVVGNYGEHKHIEL